MAIDSLGGGGSYHSRGARSDGSLSRSPPPSRVDEEQAEEDEDDDLNESVKDESEMPRDDSSDYSDHEMNLSHHSIESDHSSSPVNQDSLPTWTHTSSSNSSNSEDSLPRTRSYPVQPYKSSLRRTSSGEQNQAQPFLFQGGFFYLAFCLCALTAMCTSRATLAHTFQQVAILDANRATMDAQLQNTERGLLRIKRQIQAIDAMRSNQQHGGGVVGDANNENELSSVDKRRRQENTRALKELHGLQNRLKDEASLVDRLKNQVREAAKRDLITKYGVGPHRVEMELVFPDRKVGGANKFVIELADVEIMPHSVYTFLEMVSLGLLDGCSFILNALHVVKAAPLPYDGSSAARKAQAFTEAGLESVAFKEYSPEYPHKQYTVGFAADGSPSFFINMENNADVHAGDPCFGKIVSGLEAIKRLEAQPTRNGIWFEKRIGIKVARILKA